MGNYKTLDELIDSAQQVHKNNNGLPKYNYERIKYPYQNNGVWEIFCTKHSILFNQNFRKHLSGQTGCKECSSENKAGRTISNRKESFLKRAKSIHIDDDGILIYNYDKVEYFNNHKKVIINCKFHGDFEMTPANHTHKTNPQKCPKCSGRYIRTKEEFIKEAMKLHVDITGTPLYNYDEINYIDTTKHIYIYCKKHQLKFKQTPAKHLDGQKCKDCSNEIVAKKNTMTKEQFVVAAKLVHKDPNGDPKYDYSMVEYVNNHTNITIICKHHGPFSQSPSVHKDAKSGCPKCRISKGEQFIAHYLDENKIPYETQFKFPDCKDKRPLPFDFKVDLNGKGVLIEYQGKVHDEPANYSKDKKSSKDKFVAVQKRDQIKKEYARKNSIQLIEFTYKQKYEEIRAKLDDLFKI